jgi:hypothetical protein
MKGQRALLGVESLRHRTRPALHLDQCVALITVNALIPVILVVHQHQFFLEGLRSTALLIFPASRPLGTSGARTCSACSLHVNRLKKLLGYTLENLLFKV